MTDFFWGFFTVGPQKNGEGSLTKFCLFRILQLLAKGCHHST